MWSFCRIGTEHEKFGFEFRSLCAMTYEQISELLNGIAERFDWDKVMEGNKIIGLKQVTKPCICYFLLLCFVFYLVVFKREKEFPLVL